MTIPRVTDAKREGRPGGRPPDPEADRRIIEAAQKLMALQGFDGMSIEGVAAESGVAKTTIYRRFSDKTELAIAAIRDLIPIAVPQPTGATYDDLLEQLTFIRGVVDMGLAGTVLAEERRNPKLLDLFRERVTGPRIAQLRGILETGVEHGEVRADADLDAACDLIAGAFLAHYLAEGRPDEAWARRLLDTLWPALAAED
jgi:AcrR family transcriptional regulator